MADLKTYQISGALAYDVTPSVKVFGGAPRSVARGQGRASRSSTTTRLMPRTTWGYGYLLGAAYERPDIALRVALTYYSRIPTTSRPPKPSANFGSPTPVVQDTTTSVDTPQSVQLDFQTGVAPKTLVFGFIRWVDWSEFAIDPPVYEQAIRGAARRGTPAGRLRRRLVDLQPRRRPAAHRRARRLLLGHLRADVGGTMTSLGPYDGRTTATAALSYDYGQWNFTGGLTYGVLGDTTNLLETDFNDGSVWGAGLRVGYTF